MTSTRSPEPTPQSRTACSPTVKRLDQRAALERPLVGQRTGVGSRGDHRLGEAAGRVGEAADDAAIRAEIGVAGRAAQTLAAADDRVDRDRLAELEVGDAGADLVDDAHRLVAHHQRLPRGEHFVAAFVAEAVAVEVRAADADRVDPHPHLPRPGVRRLDLVDREPAAAVVEQGAHPRIIARAAAARNWQMRQSAERRSLLESPP